MTGLIKIHADGENPEILQEVEGTLVREAIVEISREAREGHDPVAKAKHIIALAGVLHIKEGMTGVSMQDLEALVEKTGKEIAAERRARKLAPPREGISENELPLHVPDPDNSRSGNMIHRSLFCHREEAIEARRKKGGSTI